MRTIDIQLDGRPVHFIAAGCGEARRRVREAHRNSAGRWDDPDVCGNLHCFRCYTFAAQPCTEPGCGHQSTFGRTGGLRAQSD